MSKDPYIGPKTASPGQLESVIALANSAFRREGGGDMGRQFPLLFHPERLEQLRIFEGPDGRPMSMVGAVVDEAAMLGCATSIACVGAVCTAEPARGRGLAGRLVEDAIDRAADRGVSVMLVSGHRSLYTRRGWTSAGRFVRYTFPIAGLPDGGGLEIAELLKEDCEAALRLHEREPICFRRCPADYAAQIGCRWTVNRPGMSFLVRASGRPVAVVSVNRTPPADDGAGAVMGVAEMAGSRRAAVAALKQAAGRFCPEAASAVIDGYVNDTDLWDIARALGADAETVGHLGAVKIVDAGRLWEDFAPLIRERVGPAASGVRIHVEADRLAIRSLTFERGAEVLSLCGDREAAAAVFGAVDVDPLADRQGRLAELLRRALPLPLPLYGLNYV